MKNLNQYRGIISLVFISMLGWTVVAAADSFNFDTKSVDQLGEYIVAEVDYRGRPPYNRHFQIKDNLESADIALLEEVYNSDAKSKPNKTNGTLRGFKPPYKRHLQQQKSLESSNFALLEEVSDDYDGVKTTRTNSVLRGFRPPYKRHFQKRKLLESSEFKLLEEVSNEQDESKENSVEQGEKAKRQAKKPL